MLRRIRHYSLKAKAILGTIAAVLTVLGIATFTCFILEESLQTVQFGVWPALQAGDYHTAREGLDLMVSINGSLKAVNYSVGWLHPLAFISYRAYHDAAAFFIKGTQARILAECPQAYANREVTFNFHWTTADSREDGRLVLKNGNGPIHAIVETMPDTQVIAITGTLAPCGTKFCISPTPR